MNEQVITLIDYGGSNLRSVQKAFEAVGSQAFATADPDEVRRATRLVLPGVGAFGAGMDALRSSGLAEAIAEAAGNGALLLGICLGMQFMFDESDEMGRNVGLGLIPGRVVRFDVQQPPVDRIQPHLKVPHVGWNEIAHDDRHPLLTGVASGAHAYFVHSYFCVPADPAIVRATTDYGCTFAAVVGSGRLFGIQFHPEKSQGVGLRILRNFAAMEVD